MEVETKDESTQEEEEGSQEKSGDRTTWYPYVTKTQFEKFLSRLQNKIPDEINRDYVRAIIRTPSMIYRFLRGIEAMKLIDSDQRTTERLRRLVDPGTRRETLGEIVKDLYPGLLQEWEETDGKMSDRDVVAFFRKETGMGNDSANKMKMFFKFLHSEAQSDGAVVDVELGDDDETEDEPSSTVEAAVRVEPAPQAEPARRTEPAEPAEALRQSAPQASRQAAPPRGGRDSGRQDNQADRGGRDSGRPDRSSDRGGRDSGRPDRSSDRGGRDSARQDSQADRGGRDGARDSSRDTARDSSSRDTARDSSSRDTARDDSQADRGGSQLDRSLNSRVLSEAQRAYLDTLKSVLKVNIDGDWDDDMIRLAFDRLERLFDRVRRG